MLSEAVKSYPGVAEFIIDQTVVSKEGDQVAALTFIMDNLLAPPSKDATREDTHEHAKMILSTVAASSSSELAKEKLVDQIRLSFVTSLNMVESPGKHSRIQAITSLMSIILDSRGPYMLPSALDTLFSSLNSQSPSYIAKLLIAKGLVSDLAQVPQKLDLSSPHMALTVNMCLKPLEVLTRLIYSSVLAENALTEVPEEGEKEKTLGDLILNNVVDTLLDGTVSSSSNLPTSWGGGDWSADHTPAEEPRTERISPPTSASFMNEFSEGLSEAFNSQEQGDEEDDDDDEDDDEDDSFSDEEAEGSLSLPFFLVDDFHKVWLVFY